MTHSSLPADSSIPLTRHYGTKPSFKNLLPWGCWVACFIPKEKRKVASDLRRAQEAVYLGRNHTQGYCGGIVALYGNGKTEVTPEYRADPTLFPMRTKQAQRFRPFAHPSPITGFGADCNVEDPLPADKEVADEEWEPNEDEKAESDSEDNDNSEEENDYNNDETDSEDYPAVQRRRTSRTAAPSTRAGGKNSKARDEPSHNTRSKRAVVAFAVQEVNVKKKLKQVSVNKERNFKWSRQAEETEFPSPIPEKPHLRMRQPTEEVANKSHLMLLTSHNNFGAPAPDPQTLPEKVLRDPKSITEAMRRTDAQEWIQASEDEWKNLESHDAFDWVDAPGGCQVISTTMVFKTKVNQEGKLEKYKCRLCARGDQVKDDLEDRFSPVTRLNLFRLILADAVQQKLHLKTADISGAYLFAPIGEQVVYCRPPPGYRRKNGQVMRLKKSLYGLGSSGKRWYEIYTNFLQELGFKKAGEEGTVFHMNSSYTNKLKVKGDFKITLAVYVDDSIVSYDKEEVYKALITELKNKFEISQEGDAKSFLGSLIKYDYEKGILTLTQEKFIEETLVNFDMQNANPISTPMEAKTAFSKEQCPPEEEKDAATVKSYQCLVGCLMWLVAVCRPDIAYAVIKLARYGNNPGVVHIQAARRVLRYLGGTKHLGICYRADQTQSPITMLNALPGDKVCVIPRKPDGSIPTNQMFAYADASNLDDFDSCRSTSGMVIFLGGLIAWLSRLIKVIVLSTTEAEYYALSDTIKTVMYFRDVLSDIGSGQDNPTPIAEDNEGCLHLAVENRHAADRTRHMAARRLWVIQGVRDKICEIKKCPTTEMLADFMTKPLPKDPFIRMRTAVLGM